MTEGSPVTEFDALRADDAELAELRTAIRDFLANDRDEHGWAPAVDCWLSRWDADFSIRLAEAGFVGLTIPKEYGGHGLGHLHRYVVTEELLAHGAPVGAHWIADRQVAPGLMSYGSEQQRGRLLPLIAAGRLYSAIGMSEHGAGSDLAAVASKATRTDTGWALSGTKVWTSGAHLAHQIVVLARTSPLDPAHRHAGFSQFIVPTDRPGITISPILLMDGEHHFNEVTFDDVALTDDDVLGDVGAGWHQVTAELGFERSGPERILSTATLLCAIIRALDTEQPGVATQVGDLVARMASLRQLSISVARALADGRDAASRAALVKDLGTRFEQDSVLIAAELLEYTDDDRLRAMLAEARVHSPLFTLRGGTNEVLRGVVAKNLARGQGAGADGAPDDELRVLVDDIGRRAQDADALWTALEDTGLSRLTSSQDGDFGAAAVVLGGLARWSASVPAAETDVLAAWLATQAGLDVPPTGALTVAVANAEVAGDRITGTARDVPWPHADAVLLAARTPDALYVSVLGSPDVVDGRTLGGEPRGTIAFDVARDDAVALPPETADELARRGAWARCVQIVGALEHATELTVAHTRDREQFGKPLNAFQAVAHGLASMAGELELARAAAALATAAVSEYGFGSPQADYAVTLAKTAIGRAVDPVGTIAHQLHGAIGVTLEHPLWLATMRARSWADEFGTPGHHARALGHTALAAADPWELIVGRVLANPS